MKKILRYFFFSAATLLFVIAIALVYVKNFLPDVGAAPELVIERTPERIERGAYLAKHVALCMDCHSNRDWSLFAGPPVHGTMGAGGELFDQNMGFPGKFVSPSICGESDWTDGELYRAITAGVSKDGRALFPVMPYLNYGQMDDEDIYSIIAYIRTLDTERKTYDAPSFDFPMNFIVNTIPTKGTPRKRPDVNDKIAYGKYVFTTAGCNECHTKQEKGQIVGAPMAGGFEFKTPGGIVRSANITPHETGIGNWSKDLFINRFKAYADSSYTPHKIEPGTFQTVMPWIMYAGMTEQDLGAIYDYLRTLEPVDNKIEIFTPTL